MRIEDTTSLKVTAEWKPAPLNEVEQRVSLLLEPSIHAAGQLLTSHRYYRAHPVTAAKMLVFNGISTGLSVSKPLLVAFVVFETLDYQKAASITALVTAPLLALTSVGSIAIFGTLLLVLPNTAVHMLRSEITSILASFTEEEQKQLTYALHDWTDEKLKQLGLDEPTHYWLLDALAP